MPEGVPHGALLIDLLVDAVVIGAEGVLGVPKVVATGAPVGVGSAVGDGSDEVPVLDGIDSPQLRSLNLVLYPSFIPGVMMSVLPLFQFCLTPVLGGRNLVCETLGPCLN